MEDLLCLLQQDSISFNVEFLLSIQTETTPELIIFLQLFFVFSLLGWGWGRCLPLVTQQLENSDLPCQLLGVM